jgi:AraC family transcriptional regulator, positive regulator of tynA and feaB
VKPMAHSFSTDLVPASDRLEAWRWTAKQICGDSRFQFPQTYPFHGSIERRTLAGLDFTRFSSSPVSFAKFPVVSARAEDRGCIVITQLEGVRSYCQDGATALLKPGDTTLVDSGHPWRSECHGNCARLYLRIPQWRVQNQLGMNRLPVLPQISGMSTSGSALFHLATSFYEEAEAMSAQEATAAIDAYLDVLAGCMVHPEQASSRLGSYAEHCARIERFIETHLAEPSLSPSQIAAAIGVSVRHLHRIFLSKGHTVAEWIRERRLERCRNDLLNPRLSERNITEIAFFWGFSDSAHFSKSFKKEFGLSPRAFRSYVWTGSRKGQDEPSHVFAISRGPARLN